MRKNRKTEKKVGDDVSEEEEGTDSEEEEKQPALESTVDKDAPTTSNVVSEMERASRVVNDASSSTNDQIDKGGKHSSEKDQSKEDLDNAEDSDSEEASEEDGEEVNLWGSILGSKKNT